MIKERKRKNMAKGWITLETVNSKKLGAGSDPKRFQKMENLIRNTKSLTPFEMKKESEELYAKKKAEEDSLVAAYQDKRLKSEKAIKEAQRIIKASEKAAEKTSQK